jgi:hypothetical protein
MNKENKTCFISYLWTDVKTDHVIRHAVLPALHDAGWEFLDPRFLNIGTRIFDWIVHSIRSADLIIADLSSPTQNLTYELGLAHGWGKRTILLSRSADAIPFDIASRYQVLLYSRDAASIETLRARIFTLLRRFDEGTLSLRDPSTDRLVSKDLTISIELFRKKLSPVQSIQFIFQILETLNSISSLHEASMAQIKIGSFGAWISSSLETISALVEKIIFFVPEYRMKNSQRLKIDAETRSILAQVEKTLAEANELRRESERKDVEKLIYLMEHCQTLGPSRITIGDRLFIEAIESGNVKIGIPKREGDIGGI